MKVGELFAVLGVDMSQYDKDLAVAQTKARTVGNTISDIFRNAVSFSIGMGLFNAIQNGFRSLVGTIFDFNTMMENAKIGFTTMLGSAQQAKSFLESLQDFADKTPFEFPQLQDSAKMLMAFGFEAKDVLPIMKAVGDAAAGVGGGEETISRITYALGQMRNAGRVTAQDMMQLTSAGIPAWHILAKAIGKTVPEVRKLAEEGLIPADKAVNVLVVGMEERFKDLMKNMENTWQGITSTIKDTLRGIIGKATEGAFEGLKNWLKGVRDWLQQFKSEIEKGGLQYAISEMFGPNVLFAFQMIGDAVKGIWGIISGLVNFIRSNWNIFRPMALGALLLFTSTKLVALGMNIASQATLFWKSIMAVANGTAKAASIGQILLANAINYYRLQMKLANAEGIASVGVFGAIKIAATAAWRAILGPIGIAIGAIAALIVAGILVYKNWDKVKYYGLQAWGALKIGIAYIVYGIISYYKLLLGWIPGIGEAFGKAQNALMDYINKEKTILATRKPGSPAEGSNDISELQKLKQLANRQNEIANSAGNAANAINKQADAIRNLGKAAKNTADNLQSFDEMHRLQQANTGSDGETGGLPPIKLPGVDLTNLSKGIEEATKQLGNLAKIDIPNTLSEIKKSGSEKLEGIKETFAKKWEEIKRRIGDVWDGLKSTLSWDNIKKKILDAWETFKNSDVVLKWNEIKSKIKQKYEELKTDLPNTWNGIKAKILEKWESFKNTDVATKWESIKNKILEKIGNLKTELPSKWSAVKNGILSAWETFKRSDVATKWESIKNKILEYFDHKKNPLTKPFEWGKNLIKNIVDGIKSKVNEVKKAGGTIAKIFKDLLGFSSPTKEGPGSTADKWMPNFMDMLAQGIYSNVSNIKAAVNATAGVLQGVAIQPQLGLAANNISVSRSQETPKSIYDRPIELTINLGGHTIFKEIINGINMVQRQAGKNLITI
ncbi:tape measure protein [Tepidibacillus fermentans]|uniref:Tape measure domain-containing protein n=1 Tax=Tepidibacillus fermentans TaxID=1281767 RepID=A0A4R3KBP5_9BACI|nr:tape measure protein [Tepidibacillus fermentans]TCS80383.1 tape measure domain-containing protein [Tepidibacillus fermentans]